MTKAVRKEITYTKYQFFQGRIEKINNGQRGFLPDTQKNAVELLGKEIPASVYEAVEPYKAFVIWLGSEVNPVIDKDGHKMEIQVSASGKSYFFDDAKIDAAEENHEITTSNFAAVSAETNAEIAANKARGFIKFEVGKIYFGSAFANDKFQVINLDGDFVTVKQIDGTSGGTRRMKIRSDELNNCEYVPFGSDFVDSRHEVVVSNNATEDNHDSENVEEVNESEKWEAESNAILEKTVFAALNGGHSIKLFAQGTTNFEECIELIDCYTPSEKDAEIPRTFCSDMYEEGGEVTFTLVSPKGVSYSLADYKTKEQFQTVATKLAEAIERGDKQFVFPTIEEINAQENPLNIEEIFLSVTTEIKPHIRGKYFVQVDDNWRQQSVRESFTKLADAIKIARIMHSELRKVSRHIYATVEARTIEISKYCFRADDWTTLFEISNYGEEKVKHRDSIKAIAEIENRTVEEVRNDIGRSTDNYGIYKNSAAADVEKLIAEVDAVNAEIAAKLEAEEITAIDDYIVDVDAAAEVEEINAEIAECTIPVTVLTVRESEIKAAVSKYNAIGEHFDSIMDVAVDEGLPNWDREQKKLIRKHYAAECKEKAKFLRDFFAGIGLPKKVLKISVSYDYSDILGTVDYTIEISPKTEKINADQLEKIAEYFESRDTEVEVDGFDFYEFDDVLDEEDAKIEINILSETTPDDTAAIETENVPAAVEEITAEKNSLKEKIQSAELAAENAKATRHAFLKNFYLKMCGNYCDAEGFIDYVTDYAKIIYRRDGYKYIEDADAFDELKKIEDNLKALYRKVAELKNIAEKADVLKAKIAEQKNSRKSVIDWKDAIFQNVTLPEIFKAQKELKKFLKLGQIELAENIFAMLKTLCKNYRSQFAA